MCAYTSEDVSRVFSSLGAVLPLKKKAKDLSRDKPKKVILIAGPTGCGKSYLSLILAEILKGEIVSADSMQVYRGMDIGTAKVSNEDQRRIPHHLIDIRDLHESFNIVDFYFVAKQCIDSILARDKVPIVVGGSGFYFRSLIYGPPSGPPSITDVRSSLENEMEKSSPQLLYERLKKIDPDYASTITPKDKHKIIRALEIITITGKKVTEHEWKRIQPLPEYDYHAWFIYRPRDVLYSLIDARCEDMLKSGLVEEVRGLEKKGIRMNQSASQSIGYRQCLEFLQTEQNEQDYNVLVQKIKKASRHYAKRQFTWFRKESIFRWINVDVYDIEIAAEMIAQEYNAV